MQRFIARTLPFFLLLSYFLILTFASLLGALVYLLRNEAEETAAEQRQ